MPCAVGAERCWIDQHAISASLAHEQLEVVGSERTLLEEQAISNTPSLAVSDDVAGELGECAS